MRQPSVEKGYEWLARLEEKILEPDIAIVDPHHHLWLRSGYTYLMPELAADLASGHNLMATVFAECHSMYRQQGPEVERSLGETEFVRAFLDARGARLIFSDGYTYVYQL